MARNDRFTESFERFNANLLRVLGLSRTDTERDEILDNFRERLEQFARNSQPGVPRGSQPGVQSGVPPKRRLPPPPTPGSPSGELYDQFDSASSGSADVNSGRAASGTPTHDAPADVGVETASATSVGGPEIQTVRGVDGGYGTFAVLQPKVAAQRTQRRSVRSVPKAVQPVAKRSVPKAVEPVAKRSVPTDPEARREDAAKRLRMRNTKTDALRLVRTHGGFLVPDAPTPLVLPEVPLPPAPSVTSNWSAEIPE